MAWVNELHRDGQRIGLEISASTLTGPSMGTLLHLEDVPLGSTFVQDNMDVHWCDHLAVGFVSVTVTRDQVCAEFTSVATPRKVNSRITSERVFWAEEKDGQLGRWQDQ